ncbi:MAG: hypothetical protein KDK70_08825 [Myxococcales bacterium]|nr:hypothetical protein [Myxococcales bacterium]
MFQRLGGLGVLLVGLLACSSRASAPSSTTPPRSSPRTPRAAVDAPAPLPSLRGVELPRSSLPTHETKVGPEAVVVVLTDERVESIAEGIRPLEPMEPHEEGSSRERLAAIDRTVDAIEARGPRPREIIIVAGLDARMEEVARLADRFEVASLAVGSVERAPIFEVVRPFGVAEGISVTLAFGVHGMFGAVLRADRTVDWEFAYHRAVRSLEVGAAEDDEVWRELSMPWTVPGGLGARAGSDEVPVEVSFRGFYSVEIGLPIFEALVERWPGTILQRPSSRVNTHVAGDIGG